ncbi:MAG: hypothetical protein O2999_14235 [Nitrospirae bacterium]|nr:hypothetical protein [Nitrospirota bacterium]
MYHYTHTHFKGQQDIWLKEKSQTNWRQQILIGLKIYGTIAPDGENTDISQTKEGPEGKNIFCTASVLWERGANKKGKKGDVTLFYCLNLCLKCFPALGAVELEARIDFSAKTV